MLFYNFFQNFSSINACVKFIRSTAMCINIHFDQAKLNPDVMYEFAQCKAFFFPDASGRNLLINHGAKGFSVGFFRLLRV